MGDGELSSAEVANALNLTKAGALKWINRLIAERRVVPTQARRAAPTVRYRAAQNEGSTASPPLKRSDEIGVLADPYREDWLR